MAIQQLFSAGLDSDKRRAQAWLNDRMKRGKDEIFAEVVEVTPALAEMLLALNPENRKVSPLHVSKIVRDIESGRYKLNGQPIIIARTGEMNDGQHRSTSVTQAGRSIHSLIVFGVDRESRNTLDTGKKRTVGDFLAMAGHENANQLATALRYVIQLEKHGRLSMSRDERPNEQESLEAAALHKALPQSIQHVPTRNVQVYGGRAMLAFAHYVFSFYDVEVATEFVERLLDGVGLEPRHPIYTLREWFHRARGQRFSEQEKAGRIFKAWEYFRAGEPLVLLRPGNDLREHLK